jgi:hypothetical protein
MWGRPLNRSTPSWECMSPQWLCIGFQRAFQSQSCAQGQRVSRESLDRCDNIDQGSHGLPDPHLRRLNGLCDLLASRIREVAERVEGFWTPSAQPSSIDSVEGEVRDNFGSNSPSRCRWLFLMLVEWRSSFPAYHSPCDSISVSLPLKAFHTYDWVTQATSGANPSIWFCSLWRTFSVTNGGKVQFRIAHFIGLLVEPFLQNFSIKIMMPKSA